MAELAELLERIEKATGPDEHIDCLLWQMAYPEQSVMFDGGKAFGPGPKYAATYGVLADFPLENWDDWHGIRTMLGATPLTASIDAALALVERKLPGAWYVLAKGRLSAAEPLFGCELLFNHDEQLGLASGHTQCLAILAALLRALIVPQEAVKARVANG